VTSDPYARGQGFSFEPYPALVVGRGLFLVTFVTPSDAEELTRRVADVFVEVVAGGM
jgi:hypothetical protein